MWRYEYWKNAIIVPHQLAHPHLPPHRPIIFSPEAHRERWQMPNGDEMQEPLRSPFPFCLRYSAYSHLSIDPGVPKNER